MRPDSIHRTESVALPRPGIAPAIYTVRAGDNLSSIGTSFHRSCAQLAGANSLPDPNLIMVGQRLKIPASNYAATKACPSPAESAAHYILAKYVGPAPSNPAPPGSFQQCVIARESGGNAQIYSPSGTYWGLYQFSYSTWVANGGNKADYGHASATEQTAVFNNSSPSNWAPYDGC